MQTHLLLSASTLQKNKVKNLRGEDLGNIEEIMLDTNTGHVSYAVLSFGGLFGLGDKLFAVPWASLTLNTTDKEFRLDVDKQKLEKAPGFDKDNWPKGGDHQYQWLAGVYDYYGISHYWKH